MSSTSYANDRVCTNPPAEARMQQRGRRPFELDFVLQYGTETKEGTILTEKDAQNIEAEARRQIELARRLRGILIVHSDDAIKTIFKATRRQQHRLTP